jgi:uncharacterized membrane protein YccF (DUF307 family)
MKTFGNIIWFILGGFIGAIAWLLLGIIWCVTLIGIPLGIQCFKMAGVAAFPFGKTIDANFEAHPRLNTIWLWFLGGGYAIIMSIWGAILCVTLIGIPFGKQCFKNARLAISPFGAVVSKD